MRISSLELSSNLFLSPLAGYTNLSQTAMASMRIISESMAQWRATAAGRE